MLETRGTQKGLFIKWSLNYSFNLSLVHGPSADLQRQSYPQVQRSQSVQAGIDSSIKPGQEHQIAQCEWLGLAQREPWHLCRALSLSVSGWQNTSQTVIFLHFLVISTLELFHAELKLHIIFGKIFTFLYLKKKSKINFPTQFKVFNTEYELSDKLKE